MTLKLFIRVLFANCLIIVGVNLLLLFPGLKGYLLASNHLIVSGLSVYALQFVTTAFLLKNQVGWLSAPFRGTAVIKGIISFAIVLALTAAFVAVIDKDSHFIDRSGQWVNYFTIFLLNSIPGALLEEWLFRYFPVRFAQLGLMKLPTNIFLMLILLLFMLVHIPSYLFQYDFDLSALGNVFVSGIFMLLIYLTTKNIVFTALFHAFGNHAIFMMDSDLNWQYFYASVFLVTIAWPLLEHKIAQRAARKEEQI